MGKTKAKKPFGKAPERLTISSETKPKKKALINFQKTDPGTACLAKLILSKFSGPFEKKSHLREICEKRFETEQRLTLQAYKIDQTVKAYPEIFASICHGFNPSGNNIQIVAFKPPKYVNEGDLEKFGISSVDYKNRYFVSRNSFQISKKITCTPNDGPFREFISKRNKLFGIVADISNKDEGDFSKAVL